MFNLTNIQNLVEQGRAKEALKLIDDYIATGVAVNDDNVWLWRGKINWRLGNRGSAIGDYRKACAINPKSPAAVALEQADEIMSFFNPDIFNP